MARGGCSASRAAVLAVLVACASLAFAQAPRTIAYQGFLTSSAGVPVDGTSSIVFSLHDAASAGNLLWTETQSVSVTNGNYAVILGNGTPINLAFNIPVWLGVKLSTETLEMAPRAALAMAPYAFRALAADAATTVTGAVSGAQISGAIPSANLSGTYTGNVTFTNGVFSGAFSGAFTGGNAGIAGLSQLGVRSVAPDEGCVVQGGDLFCGFDVCDPNATRCSDQFGACRNFCILPLSDGGGLGEPGLAYRFAPVRAPGEGEVTFTQTLPAVICNITSAPIAIHFELRVIEDGATTTVGTAHANLPETLERQSPWAFIPQSTIAGSYHSSSLADLDMELLPAQFTFRGQCFLAQQTRFNLRHISGSRGALD